MRLWTPFTIFHQTAPDLWRGIPRLARNCDMVISSTLCRTPSWTCSSLGGIPTSRTLTPLIISASAGCYDWSSARSNAAHRSIDIFFKCDPCGSRVLHKPSFLASMHLHPKDPNYPHPAILHAIVRLGAVLLGRRLT